MWLEPFPHIRGSRLTRLVHGTHFLRLGTLASLAALLYGTVSSRLEIGWWGLVHSMSPMFLVGLTVLVVSAILTWATPQDCSALVFGQNALLIMALWGAPTFLRGVGWSREQWFLGYQDYIVRNGHLNPGLLLQHNWPSQPVLMSAVQLVSGINGVGGEQAMLSLAPIATILFWMVPVSLFFRRALSERNNLWGAGVWVFFLANRSSQEYLSAQSLAYFLWLTAVWWSLRSRPSPASSVLTYTLTSAIVTAHALTSAMSLAAKAAAGRLRTGFLPHLLVGSILLLAWNLYWAVKFHPGAVSEFFRYAMDPEFLRLTTVARLGGPRLIYSHVDLLSRVYLASFGALALLGACVELLCTRSLRPFAFPLALGALTVAVMLAIPYSGGERLTRAALFLQLPLAFFIVRLFLRPATKLIVVLAVIAWPFLFLVTRYGYEAYEYVRPSEGAAVEWVVGTIGQRPVELIGDARFLLGKYNEYYRVRDFSTMLPASARPLPPLGAVSHRVAENAIIVANRTDRTRLDMSLGSQAALDEIYERFGSEGHTLFDDGYVKVYSQGS